MSSKLARRNAAFRCQPSGERPSLEALISELALRGPAYIGPPNSDCMALVEELEASQLAATYTRNYPTIRDGFHVDRLERPMPRSKPNPRAQFPR